MEYTETNEKQELINRGLPVKPCGLNADWSCSAWHLSEGEPNITPGHFYLLDEEESGLDGQPLYCIVTRTYVSEDQGNDEITIVIAPGLLSAVLDQWKTQNPTTEPETVQCGLCRKQTQSTGTKRCDPCWELERGIQANPDIARKILVGLAGSIVLSPDQVESIKAAFECAEFQLTLTATAIRGIPSDAWGDIAGGCEKQADVVRRAKAGLEAK